MKKFLTVVLLVVALTVALAVPVAAAPGENASHVAFCAVTMGGQHVAECAKTMDRGVSTCARMKGPCDH